MSTIPTPRNEPIRGYAPGSPERRTLCTELARRARTIVPAPNYVAGPRESATRRMLVAPHRRDLALCEVHLAARGDVADAIAASLAVAPEWARTPFAERAAIFLRAADLFAGPYRDAVNATTILGQSKSFFQSEIDAACELIDFLRFNAAYGEEILARQPSSPPGAWNALEYRPLEGFVYAISPFNFTSIACNLPTAPALMGNVVLWKPSPRQAYSATVIIEVLEAAGLPPGVIGLVNDDGPLASEVALAHPRFAGLHYTGSTAVFRDLWRRVGEHLPHYATFPRLVGETGGKNFVVVHPSADVPSAVVALARGAFEYQGQKCSAASRAFVPRSLWPRLAEGLREAAAGMRMGDVADPQIFLGAVVSGDAFARHRDAIAAAIAGGAELVLGGGCDDAVGWFVEPTVLRTEDPRSATMTTELFGPILTVFVYDDADFDATLRLVDETSAYGLTGAILARDRSAITRARDVLLGAAGNFYVNDKPTGAVVDQQPFGGARASGTNDKAGSALNLLRWVSPRAIKETFDPPCDWRYPHLAPEAP